MSDMQLRILTGTHAGACAALPDHELSLGADSECDIVLADAGLQPRHARLVRDGDSCLVHWLPGEPGAPLQAPVALRPGLAVAIGSVIVAVDAADAPWPTLEQLVLVQTVASMEAGAQVQADADELEQAAPGEPEEPAPAAPARPRRLAAWRKGHKWFALLAGVVGVVAVPAAFVAWPRSAPMAPAAAQPDAAAVAAMAASQAQAQAQRQAIEAALQAQGLLERVKIVPSGSGWLVRASYVDDATAEKLGTALARVSPLPVLRMSSEQDLPQDVDEALVRLTREGTGSVKAVYLGDARFRLEGRLPSVRERDALLRGLREAFPTARGWDSTVQVPEETADKLLAELRAAGWEVSGQWQDGVYAMDVKLSQQQVPQWERSLAQAMTRNSVPMKAQLAIGAPSAVGGAAHGTAAAASAVAAGAAPEGRLPFQVRAVIGGDAPYVVLADGGRLSLDGVHQGWRLRAFEPQRVLFDNGSQRASVPR